MRAAYRDPHETLTGKCFRLRSNQNPAGQLMMSRSEAFKNVMTGLAALAAPIAVAYLANYYAAATKDKDVGVKFVELATTILSKDPSSSDQNVRRWAIRILEKYSDVPLSEEAREAITAQVPLPEIRNAPIPEGSRPFQGIRSITRIIVRDTQQDDLEPELTALKTSGVAYHYLIGKDGTVQRLVDENDIAMHTSNNNADSIGIGLMHRSGTKYEPALVDALKKLLTDVAHRRNIEKRRIFAASEIDPKRKSDFPTIKDAVTADIP